MRPFLYQEQGVRAIEEFGGRTLVSYDMGLGKSAISLWYAQRNNKRPMIVTCPASVKYQWQVEAKKVVGWDAVVCEGMKPKNLPRANIYIINYEILYKWIEVLKKQARPTLVVLDECQYIMNPKAKRTKAVKQLCNGVKHVLCLSGTPMLNRPIELFPTIQILRPTLFRSRFKYAVEYCDAKKGPFGWDFNGASNLKKLNQVLSQSCMIRKRRDEVLRDLPQKIQQVVPVPMRADVAKDYRRAEKDFVGWLAERDTEAALKAARAVGLTKAGFLLRLAAKAKLKASVDWINDWLSSTNQKMIIFCIHTKMKEALVRRIKHELVVVVGPTGRKRQDVVDKFQNDPSCRAIITNIHAGGVGLNLTAASAEVFLELPWQPGALAQAEARAHRIGQTRSVNVYYLIARNTIEQRRCEIIQKKLKVIDAVLDGFDSGDLDVFDELMKEVKLGFTS